MRIALVQMEVEDGRVQDNVDKAQTLLESAPDADIFLLPELWTSGYAHHAWETIADKHTPAVVDLVADWAARREAIIGGTQVSRGAKGELVNRFWTIGGDSRPVFYDKGHLFEPMREPQYLTPGTSRARIALGEWTAGLSVCFDLRFPEQYRLDALAGADLFLVSSAWPEPRCATLQVLARARAIENQAVLALCNRTGPDTQGTLYCGGSTVFGPNGEALGGVGLHEGVSVVEVRRECLLECRGLRPTLSMRAEGLDW